MAVGVSHRRKDYWGVRQCGVSARVYSLFTHKFIRVHGELCLEGGRGAL
jgi:hypothetical protein